MHLRNPLSRCIISAMVFFIAISPATAQQLRLRIETAGVRQYSPQCGDPHGDSYIAGSSQGIAIVVDNGQISESELPYRGVTDWTWPAGLEIQVGLQRSVDDHFQPSEDLLSRLQLQYFVSDEQIRNDKLWHQTGQLPLSKQERFRKYHFAFSIPDDITDQYLCFRSAFSSSEFGHLTTDSSFCMSIIQPCNDTLRSFIAYTKLMFADRIGNKAQALAFADSLIATGWRDPGGLQIAQRLALESGQFEKARHYLDLRFETYGTLSLDHIDGGDPQREREVYLRARERITTLENQYKAQHQIHD